MKHFNLFSLLFTLFFLQACLPTMQIEESGIINTRGVDLVEEDSKMIETTIIPYLFDPNSEEITSILIGRANTVKKARENAANQSSYRLTPGQIRLEIYGKEAAEEGVLTFLTPLIRDARVSDSMQLAVTDLTAREILEAEQGTIQINTAQYLQDLLSKDRDRHTLPKNSLHGFARTVEKVGLDPVLPLIGIEDNLPSLVGAALFQGDKYVASIDLSEATLINIMLNRVKDVPIEAAVPFENYEEHVFEKKGGELSNESELIYLFFSSTRGRGKLTIKDQNSLHYQADIKLDAELLETSIPIDVRDEEIAKQLEQDTEEYLVDKFKSLFAKMQEANADSFGSGQLYTTTRQGSGTTQDEWLEQYPEVTIDFTVDFTIINFGTID